MLRKYALALALAQELVANRQDRSLPLAQRSFAYMPYMHSESALVHAQAVELFSQPGLEDTLRFELRHKEIIDRFGRYPHRNALLGRASSSEELAFLTEPGSAFYNSASYGIPQHHPKNPVLLRPFDGDRLGTHLPMVLV